MNRSSVAYLLLAASLLTACGDAGPIAQTADAAAPVVADAPSVGQIYGRWASDTQMCQADAGDRGTVSIGDARFETGSDVCEMTTPEPNGEGWLVTLACAQAQEDESERVRFVPEGDKLLVTYIDRTDSNEQRLTRCE